jgi:hypothetical protein
MCAKKTDNFAIIKVVKVHNIVIVNGNSENKKRGNSTLINARYAFPRAS